MSQRRIARVLGINCKTVVRKLLFLSAQANLRHEAFLATLRASSGEKVRTAYFDEMETFERSKCLPLSLPLVVNSERKVLAFDVCSMPAKGPLTLVSLRKYGPRADDRGATIDGLLRSLVGVIDPAAEVSSDKNPRYPAPIKEHFPEVTHRVYKGRRGCVVGQGELKRGGHDPLFPLNHTAAMFRANVNRLFRRTWCTTKRAERLKAHLSLYVDYHNRVLTAEAA